MAKEQVTDGKVDVENPTEELDQVQEPAPEDGNNGGGAEPEGKEGGVASGDKGKPKGDEPNPDLGQELWEKWKAGTLEFDSGEPKNEPEPEPTPGEPQEPSSEPGSESAAPPEPPPFEEKFIHNGEEVVINDREEARKLMAQGFDYGSKMGRHKRLAELLDARPDLAQRFGLMLQQELGGGVPPQQMPPPGAPNMQQGIPGMPGAPGAMPGPEAAINPQAQQPVPGAPVQQAPATFQATEYDPEKYDSEAAWLAENLNSFGDVVVQKLSGLVANNNTQPQAQPVAPEQKTWEMLQVYDPVHWQQVARQFPKYIDNLTRKNARMMEIAVEHGDFSPLIRFYDEVKKAEGIGSAVNNQKTAPAKRGNTVQQKPPAAAAKKKTPSFRVRSGAGPVPGEKPKVTDWDKVPRQQFNKLLNELKSKAV